MTYPAGVQLSTLTFSNPTTFLGNPAARTTVTLQSTAAVVWAATGDPIDDFAETVDPGPGMPGSLTAPFVNQTGFTDQAGNTFTGWAYIVTRTSWLGNVFKTVQKNWQPVIGQNTVDFDTLPGGAIGLPVSSPPLVVTSVVGQNGAVTGSQIAADPALIATFVPKWKATTAYLAGDAVLSPAGDTVTAKVNFTSGASYNAANWNYSANYGRMNYPTSLAAGVPLAGSYSRKGQQYGNFDTGLKRFNASLARARVGQGTSRILLGGDSIMLGYTNAPYETNCPAARFRTAISDGRWGPVYEGETFFCNWVDGVTGTNSDSRMVFGSGWTKNAGAYGIGGQALIQASAGNTTTFDYGPVTCDTFIVYYLDLTSVFQFAIDGGSFAPASFSPTGSVTVKKMTIPAGSTGSHTLHLKAHATTGTAYIVGVGYYTAANTGGVTVMRAGQPGSTTNDWAANNNGQMTAIDACAPDLAVLQLGTNDMGVGSNISVATYTANLTTLVNRFSAAGGDTLLMVPPPRDGTTSYLQSYRAAIYSVADTLGVPVLDIASRWPDPTSAKAAPYSLLQSDTVHPTLRGGADLAQAIADALH